MVGACVRCGQVSPVTKTSANTRRQTVLWFRKLSLGLTKTLEDTQGHTENFAFKDFSPRERESHFHIIAQGNCSLRPHTLVA